MKKIVLIIALLATSVSAFAYYSFSAVCSTGQTLYYYTTSDSTVAVTYPGSYGSNDYYYGVSKPTGKLIIPDSVIYMGNIYRVTRISDNAFHGCSGIRRLVIPNSVTDIGLSAFYGCSGIDSLYIGCGVISIGSEAFSGCTGLNYLHYNARYLNTGNFMRSDNSSSSFYNTATNNFRTLVIGDSVRAIPDGCFYGRSSIDSIIVIPDSVTGIGNNAFYGCSSIDTLLIGSGLTSIGSSAFSGCSSIHRLEIPNNVTSIGQSAFDGCSGIDSLHIGSGITTIGNCVFQNCSSIQSLVIPGNITSIGNNAFHGCMGIENISLGNGVVSIGNSAFQGCIDFTKLAIPSSVTSIGSNAFYGCTGIDSLYIGNGVQTIGSGAFRGCTGLRWLNYNAPNLPAQGFYGCTQLATLILGSTVQNIDNEAFYNCDNLLTAYINTPLIGRKAFADCDRLVTVTFGDNVNTLSREAFSGCFRLQSITFGTGIDSIPSGMFNGCVRLENMHLSNNLHYIGDSAFYGCSLIHDIVMPEGLNAIGNHAFSGCSAISGMLEFPSTITSIGDYAFRNNGTITELRMKGSNPPTIYAHTFTSVSNNTPVSVPCGAVMSYYTTNYWENFSTIVEAPPYRLIVESNNETMGSAAVNQQPTCSNHSAIIQASAEDGFHFLQWNDGNGTNPRTIQMTQDSTFTAIFVPNNSYIVIEPNDPTMGTTSGTGTYGYNAPVTMTATAYSGYHFLKWNDGNTQNPRYMAAVCDTTFTAIFVSNVSTITVMNANPEWGNVGGSGVYYYQNLVSLTATPNYGYHFSQWNDGNTQNPRTIVISQDSTFTAYFAVNTYSIVATSNSTTMGSVSGGGTYTYLHEMSLTATPAYGYHFVQWNDQNTDNPRTITVTRDSAFTAQFAANSYTITAEPNDPTMGSAYGSGTYNYNTTVTLTAVETYGYHFTQWSDGVTDNPRTITVQNSATYTAQFEINSYIITVQSSDPAIGTASGGGSFNYLTPVYITANPNPGYHFTQWSDGNTDNPRLINVTQNATYTAQFAINSYEVVVNANDSSMGNVSGSGTYYHNMPATIMATPNYGYHFVMWSDGSLLNPRTITVTNDIAVTAMFAPTQYSFLCTSNSNTMGTVSLSGGNYDYQTTLSVEAIPNYGYHFVSWNDGVTVNPRSIVITQDTVLQAIFAINQYTLTVDVNEASMGAVSGMGSYDYLSQVTIGATAAAHHHFVQWSDGNTTNPRLVILTRDTSFTAIFEQELQFQITVNANDATMGSVEGGGMYYLGETTTITATANEHYYFAQWSDGMTSNPRVITVTGDMAYTAVFEPVMYTLTVSANDYSMGQVTGGGSYAYGTEVTIEARAFGGYRFLGWNDGVMDEHRTVTVTENASYTAMFEQNTGIEDVETTSYKVYVMDILLWKEWKISECRYTTLLAVNIHSASSCRQVCI